MMSNSPSPFDPIAVVVDWLDACRERRLADLVDLYDPAATIDCCTGDHFEGHAGLLRYWTPKLENPSAGAFLLNEVQAQGAEVRLDYCDYDGRAVRTTFRFDAVGKILHTSCSTAGRDGASRAVA
jgi:hypothetical protein